MNLEELNNNTSILEVSIVSFFSKDLSITSLAWTRLGKGLRLNQNKQIPSFCVIQKWGQLWGVDYVAGKDEGQSHHFGAVMIGPMQVDGNRKAGVSGKINSHFVWREGRREEKVPDHILSPTRLHILFLKNILHFTCSSMNKIPFLQPKISSNTPLASFSPVLASGAIHPADRPNTSPEKNNSPETRLYYYCYAKTAIG